MIDYKDLRYTHKNGCLCTEEEHKNVYYDERGEVEYDAYCKECGAFLYNFCYGNYET